VRNRHPVIHNDYERYAAKQGLPTGHFPLFRHLSIPIFHQEKITAILGVGNRDILYYPYIVDALLKFLDQVDQDFFTNHQYIP
jgi:hypothetical protein